jgi:hypothetical protein
MSFVDCYLAYFRQWLVTHLLSALLPLQPLFTESIDQLLAPLPFSSALTAPSLLCCVPVFSYLFIGQVFVVVVVVEGVSVCPGGYAGLSQEWLGEYCVMLGAHVFGLPKVSQAGLEPLGGGGSPPVFSM